MQGVCVDDGEALVNFLTWENGCFVALPGRGVTLTRRVITGRALKVGLESAIGRWACPGHEEESGLGWE